MWIEEYQRRYRWDYYDKEVEVYSWTKGDYVTRTRKVWKPRPHWVLVKVWVGKKKYQKQPHHKKKVKTEKELNREAWRQHKQVRRDKAKRQDLHGYLSNGCPPWMKRHCNKRHRQWERRMIESGQYERTGRTYKRKDIFDPWLWD